MSEVLLVLGLRGVAPLHVRVSGGLDFPFEREQVGRDPDRFFCPGGFCVRSSPCGNEHTVEPCPISIELLDRQHPKLASGTPGLRVSGPDLQSLAIGSELDVGVLESSVREELVPASNNVRLDRSLSRRD